MMEPYKGYFIDGSALMTHPFSPDWYVCGSVYVLGTYTSIVEISRFQLQRFTVSIKELAEWFGLEVARIVVDKCLATRENWMVNYLQRSCPKWNAKKIQVEVNREFYFEEGELRVPPDFETTAAEKQAGFP